MFRLVVLLAVFAVVSAFNFKLNRVAGAFAGFAVAVAPMTPVMPVMADGAVSASTIYLSDGAVSASTIYRARNYWGAKINDLVDAANKVCRAMGTCNGADNSLITHPVNTPSQPTLSLYNPFCPSLTLHILSIPNPRHSLHRAISTPLRIRRRLQLSISSFRERTHAKILPTEPTKPPKKRSRKRSMPLSTQRMQLLSNQPTMNSLRWQS